MEKGVTHAVKTRSQDTQSRHAVKTRTQSRPEGGKSKREQNISEKKKKTWK